jgi:hypothetical protein
MPTTIPHPDYGSRQTPASCLGFTCLKWSASGELSELDRALVVRRLAQADPELQELAAEAS